VSLESDRDAHTPGMRSENRAQSDRRLTLSPGVHESGGTDQGIGESANPETNRACDNCADREAKSFPTPGAAPAVELHQRKQCKTRSVPDRGSVPDSVSGTLHSFYGV
jgi:hypothetical protein